MLNHYLIHFGGCDFKAFDSFAEMVEHCEGRDRETVSGWRFYRVCEVPVHSAQPSLYGQGIDERVMRALDEAEAEARADEEHKASYGDAL